MCGNELCEHGPISFLIFCSPSPGLSDAPFFLSGCQEGCKWSVWIAHAIRLHKSYLTKSRWSGHCSLLLTSLTLRCIQDVPNTPRVCSAQYFSLFTQMLLLYTLCHCYFDHLHANILYAEALKSYAPHLPLCLFICFLYRCSLEKPQCAPLTSVGGFPNSLSPSSNNYSDQWEEEGGSYWARGNKKMELRERQEENSCGAQTVPSYMVRSEAAGPYKRQDACVGSWTPVYWTGTRAGTPDTCPSLLSGY